MARTSRRRRKIRDDLWDDAKEVTYYHKNEDGFFTAPRTLPLVARLTKVLSSGIDPSQVYLELWSRMFDPPGFVEIVDEEECANSAGFMGASGRSIRSWRERVRALEQLGFIRVGAKGTRDYAYVLLVHPHQVVQALHDDGQIPESWWTLFRARLRDIGAPIPKPRAELEAEREAAEQSVKPDDWLPF